MPDTPYVDSGLQTGISNTDILQLKMETMNNFDRIMNQQPQTAGQFDFFPDPEVTQRIDESQKIIDDIKANRSSFTDYLTHPDKNVRDIANGIVEGSIAKDPFYKSNAGGIEAIPYDKSMDKFLGKDYGYRPERDNEDFYYRNEYMADNWFARNLIYNPARFIGRVVPQAILKLGEGLGYAGAMLTSIGSDNYWADVADNALSKALEGAEESVKNAGFLTVYKQAGFDEKGFFSKLIDWSFWNDSVADGVAFMASAMIPGTAISKLGLLGKLGTAFEATSALGKMASAVGLGSGDQIAAWTLSTAMEAAQEGSGVYKEVSKRLKEARARGENQLSDEDIKQQAGQLAGNTVLQNFAVLGLSNAWENKLLFKALGKGQSKALVSLGDEMVVGSQALAGLEKKGLQMLNPLSRAGFYGRKALEGFVAEGLWEENAQLAIQRMNQGDSNYDGFFGFWQQLGKQTYDASWLGNGDAEAAESIGLGALIGMGAGTVLSKFSGERKNQIAATKQAIADGNDARQRMLNVNDQWERDTNNKIVFDEKNQPKVDPVKQQARQRAIEIVASNLGLASTKENLTKAEEFLSKSALADYVRSLTQIGIENIGSRMMNKTAETAALFGINPAAPSAQNAPLITLADTFEQQAKAVNKIKDGVKPADLDQKTFVQENHNRRAAIYMALTDNTIVSAFAADENSKILEGLASYRTLATTSPADSAIDKLNLLNQQRLKNQRVIESPIFKNFTEPEQKYHLDRAKALQDEMDDVKKSNETVLEGLPVSEKGFYTPHVDGKKISIPLEVAQASSRLADYNNIMHKNSHMATLFTGSFEGYMKWTKSQEAVQAPVAPTMNVGGKKFRENVKGDFDRVTKLVSKIVFSDDKTFTPDELQLQQNYAALIEELIPLYEKAVENQRIQSMLARVEALKSSNAQIEALITQQNNQAEDAKIELEILQEELENIANQGKVKQREIAKAINSLQEKIANFDNWYKVQMTKLQSNADQIQLLEQEIAGGSFRGLVGAVEELKKERDWLETEIQKTTSLIDRLAKLIGQIRRLAYKLFGTKSDFARNLEKGRQEAVNYSEEITRTTNDLAEARELAKQLEAVRKDLKEKYEQDKRFIDGIMAEVDAAFKKAYLDMTEAKPEPVDPEDEAISKAYVADKEAFPQAEQSEGVTPDDEDGFDGNSYQRPLSTKFFTSTFPYIVRGEPTEKEQRLLDANIAYMWDKVPQTVKDYFEFVDFMTDPANGSAIKAKVGTGSVKMMVVTRNNVEKLNLSKVLDRNQWFEIKDAATTHVEVIPVLETTEGVFYVDTKLNKLGKVGETPDPKLVRSVLRTAKFTEDEMAQYSEKYTEADMNKAIKVATDWRKTLLDQTAKETMPRFEYNITRGIANKMIMQDKSQARNTVVGNLIPTIKPDSVVVFSNVTNTQVINGEAITLPSGRPFIKSTNDLPFAKGGHVQFHAADNGKLDAEQVAAVTEVMDAMMKDHISKVMDKVNNNPDFKRWKEVIEKAGGIHKLDKIQKRKLFFNVTSEANKKGYPLFNSNYTIYLSSILHFSNVEKNKNPTANQIHFVGPNLVFGDSGVSVDMTTQEGLRDFAVQSFLSRQYHNIKYFTKPEVQKREFIEYIVENKKLETRVWDNYAEYLLSPTTPAEYGSKPRLSIPVTTAVATKPQHDARDTTEPYYKYISRGITVLTPAQTSIKKTEKKKGLAAARERIADVQGKSPQTKQRGIEGARARIAAVQGNKPAAAEVQPTPDAAPKAKGLAAAQARIAAVQAKQNAPAEPAASTVEPVEEAPSEVEIIQTEGEEFNVADLEPVIFVPGSEPLDEPYIGEGQDNFRISKGGVFRTEEDLDAVIAKIQALLPQFPIIRLKNIIKTLDGREAFGQFVNDTIKIYEGAEEGTLYHEAFEAVANKILTDREWRAMQKEFNERKGYFTERETGERLRYADATAQQAKEQLAEEFREYMMNGTLPNIQPQTKSFFRILWDFIKSLFVHSDTINGIFQSIEQGKFAQSSLRSQDRFSSNYSIRMPGVPVQVVRDLFEGATAEMFRYIFNSPDSLSSLDNIDETDESLYEPIKQSFLNKRAAIQAELDTTGDERLKDRYREAIKNLTIATDNWPAFVQAHKDELKRFKIKFEEDQAAEDTEDNRNRNDYAQDQFKTDGKNSASKSVKFLFGTLLKLRFDRNGATTTIDGKIVGKTEAIQSPTYLNSLAGYDEYMFKALDNFQGMNDWSRIKAKMEELAGVDRINALQGSPAEMSKVISGMSREEATWTSLYTRMFGYFPNISPDAQWMLKVKVHNYVSKFAPTSWLFLDGGGVSVLIDAVQRPYFEKIQRKIGQGIIKGYNKFLQKDSKEGATVPRAAYKGTIGYEDFEHRNDTQIKKGRLSTPVEEMVEFLNLKEELTPEFLYNKLSTEERIKIINNLLTIRNAIPNMKVYGKAFTIKTLDIVGFTKNLIINMSKNLDVIQKTSQIQGINNEMRQIYVNPSFISRFFSEIENVSNLSELYNKFPHLAQVFSKDSIILTRLFNEDGTKKTDYKVSLDYLAGTKDTDEQKGTASSQLEFHDRYFQQFNASLSGLYLSLPADSETDWAFNFGEEFVSYSENMLENRGERLINKLFIPKLKTEIDLARTNSSRLAQLNERNSDNTGEAGKANSSVGSSLRFFKNMLWTVDRRGKYSPDTNLLQTIYEEMDRGKSAEVIIASHGKKITKAIKNYIAKEVAESKNLMLNENLVLETADGYLMRGLNNDFIESYQGSFKNVEGSVAMTEASFTSLLEYQKINSTLASMESFKLVYGDPAQYKDWEKRAKSMFSPYEQIFYDETGEFNEYLNKAKNTVAFGDDSFELATDDMFRMKFADRVNSRTINDLTVVDAQTVNDLRGLGGEFINKFIGEYEKTNEADGQSIGTLEFARQLMIKSGWRWTPYLEAYYQYDNALLRRFLAGKGEYAYDPKLKEIDDKLINYYETDTKGMELIAKAKLTPLKTLMPTQDENGNQMLMKHSIHFMSFQVAKDFELFDLYKNMMKSGEQLLNFKSAQKVGLENDNSGKITDYYESPFKKRDLVKAGNPLQSIDLRNLGIQVETQTSEWGQTLGSQLTKLIHLSLSEQGVPIDFEFDGSISERIEKWNSLSEEEKLDVSDKYRKIKGAIDSLKDLKLKNTLDKFTQLGVRWKYDAEKGFSYEVEDLTKVKDYITNELRRLDVDSNTIDNIELNENRKAFENPAETTPSYETISNLLWSMADKAVTSMKVNGKPLVQVASSFFNKGSRQAAYQDETGKWITLETKEAYDKFVAENNKLPEAQRKKIVMTASELKFYSLGENGINAMEIYLPHIYRKKINDRRQAMGLSNITDEELMDWLNKPENSKLLEGIGFRIPTQATSSIEFFKIKGFLPEVFGSSVVVPSAITTKAGSDFDVDKLNTYLNNWKLDSKGMPYYEEFLDDSNSSAEERYDLVYRKKRKFLETIDALLLRKYEKEFLSGNIPEAVNNMIDSIFGVTDDISFYTDEEVNEILSEGKYKNVSYNRLVKEAKEEGETAPDLEKFKSLPMVLQNTKGAVENMYFQSIRDILSSKDMFAQLLSPNSADNIKEMRDEVFKAKDETYDPKKAQKKGVDYSRFTSTEWIAEKRNQFVKGKKDIGIGAVAMTNFANSGIVGLSIAVQGKVKDQNEREIIYELNGGHVGLPFADIETLKIDGKLTLPLSKLKDKQGNYTMDKLSGYINGFVDVAKDPFIAEMGMHSEFAGVYMMLERMGLSGKTTALFMYQPVIRDFLKKILLLDSKSYFGFNNFLDTRGKIQKFFIEEYKPENFEYDPDFRFTDERLIELIRKGEAIKRGEAKDFTREEKAEQFMALITYMKLKVYGNHLIEDIQASNHDTSSIRNSESKLLKDLKLERAKKGNMVVKLENNKVINGGQALRDGTSVSMDISMFNNFEDLFTDINLFALQKTNPRQALYKIGRRVYFENPFTSQDDFISIMRDYKSSMIDLLVNDTEIPVQNDDETWQNVKMYKYYKNLFKTELDGKPNTKGIKHMVDTMRKNYPNTFKGNFFLENLEVNTDTNLGIDMLQLSKVVMNNEVLTKEKLIEALIQLSNYNPDDYPTNFKKFAKDMNKLYRMILYGAYMQYGIRFSRNSFVNVLPVKDASVNLTDLTKFGLSKIDSYDFTYVDEQIQRSKWYRKGVVQEQMFNAINSIEPSSVQEGKYVLNTNAQWKGGKKGKKGEYTPPKKTNQTFFGRVVDVEEGETTVRYIVPNITPIMIWNGYEGFETEWEDAPNIIKAPAVKPEYLRWVAYFSEETGMEVTRWDVLPVVYEMIKKGDHSYMFTQLFKKVGIEDRSLARKFVTKKNKKGLRSVNYLYKPINKQGDAFFNEFKPLLLDDNGSPYMGASIIDAPAFKEQSDTEIVSNIVNSPDLVNVFEPDMPTKITPMKTPKPGDVITQNEKIIDIAMTADNVLKIASGKKTTTVRTEKQAAAIAIKPGHTAIRRIGGDLYNVTNRGFLTLTEAGGIKAILASEGLSTEEAAKFPTTKQWLEGKGKLYVYDIKPLDNPVDPGDKPPIEPPC